MAAKKIIIVNEYDDYGEAVAELWQSREKWDLNEFVETIRKDYPQALCESLCESELSGFVSDWNDRYIMTTESDNFGDTMCVYERMDN